MAKPDAIGFDGLSSFATDVDGAIAAADRIAAGPRRAPPPTSSPSPSPMSVHRDGGAVAGGVKKLVGWVVGIGLIIAIKACVWGGVHAVTDSRPTTYSYSSPTSSDQPSDQVAGAGGASDSTADNMTASDAAGDAGQTDGGPTAPGTTTSGAPDGMGQDDGSLSKPIPGYATLSIAELRYCMAENIRMSSQKAEMDSIQFTDADRYNRNVNGFNDAVNDYNNSCSNRSIMERDRSTATSQIEQQRSQLETEGRARVQ